MACLCHSRKPYELWISLPSILVSWVSKVFVRTNLVRTRSSMSLCSSFANQNLVFSFRVCCLLYAVWRWRCFESIHSAHSVVYAACGWFLHKFLPVTTVSNTKRPAVFCFVRCFTIQKACLRKSCVKIRLFPLYPGVLTHQKHSRNFRKCRMLMGGKTRCMYWCRRLVLATCLLCPLCIA